MKNVFFIVLLMPYCTQSWTWAFKKTFQREDFSSSQKSICFGVEKTNLFTQLIFSWNALRPQEGHLSFYVQVHTYKGGWSDVYKMLDWGNGVQKSYLHKEEGKPSFFHVRLEMPADQFADAFNIIVQAHEGAILHNLKMLNISITNFKQFEPELPTLINFNTLILKNVPKISQFALKHEDSHRICSPTSLTMLLSFLKKEHIHPINVAQSSYDHGLGAYGSWPFNTAHAFELHPSYYFKVERLASFKKLYEILQRGFPVVVSVRGHLPGAPKLYENGHLLLVIGWHKKSRSVIVHDPAFDHHKKVLQKYPIKEFLKAWERSNRLAYVTEIVDF